MKKIVEKDRKYSWEHLSFLQYPSTDQVSYKLKKETADTVVLDLAGHRAPTKIDTRSMHFTASLEEIEEFKRRGIAAARAAGMIVDIESTEQVTGTGTQGLISVT